MSENCSSFLFAIFFFFFSSRIEIITFHRQNTVSFFITGMLCGLLIRNYLAVNDQLEATQSSAAVKEFHEEVFCDVVNKKLQIFCSIL